MTFKPTSFNLFQSRCEQDYISDRSTIAAIMRKLPKLDLFTLFPSLEKLENKGNSGKYRSSLLNALNLDENTERLTLAECVRLTKNKMPAYARGGDFTDGRLDTICGCLSMLSYSHGVSLRKNKLL